MDKQELIKKYEETIYAIIATDEVLKDLKQLDEPQKVEVPQFVANWYEEHKDNLEYNIWDYVFMFNKQEETSFKKWFNDSKTKPFQTLVNMHQFGYEVDKEKRYKVKIKGISDHNDYLKYNKNMKHWYFGSLFIYNNDVDTRTYHTHKEIEEAGFGWVFDCPGIEIVEVEG